MSKVLCIIGVVLVCLHTFTVVKTSPTRSSSLQRRLRRNLTILARTYNLTPQGSPKRTKLKHHCSVERLNSGLDPYLINATPTNARKVMLYSKNGFFLRIANNGDVAGTNDEKRATVWFELQKICVGVVRIKNIATSRYLAMDKNGVVRGRINRSYETLFFTKEVNGYHWYRSYKHRKWFVGIRKNGTQKPARQTAVGQKAVLFLDLSDTD